VRPGGQPWERVQYRWDFANSNPRDTRRAHRQIHPPVRKFLHRHHAGDDGQVDLTYHVSAFDNNYNSLTWQNPFFATGAPTAGSMSLAPDNEFHQLSLTGGYTLPYRSRLTLLSIGRGEQGGPLDDCEARRVRGNQGTSVSIW